MVFLPDRFFGPGYGHVFFFCVCAAGVARPSFKCRSLYSRFAVGVVENLLWGRLGLSRPGTVPSW